MERAEYATMFRVEETHWWYRALHRLIFQALEAELPDWREKQIVDVGCGTGAILKRLGNPEKNVGIDLAPEAISFCRERALTMCGKPIFAHCHLRMLRSMRSSVRASFITIGSATSKAQSA